MSKTWKNILIAAGLIIAIIVVYQYIHKSGKEIRTALENLESSKASLDAATKKVEESHTLIETLQQNVDAYAKQIQQSDSVVGVLEKKRIKTEKNFYSRIGTAEESYYDLKEQLDRIRIKDWPVIIIDTTRQKIQ